MGGHGGEVELPEGENDPFVKRVALSVAVFAVVLALAASGGNNAGKDMMMYQLKASNEWSRFQAKSQREVLYMQEREQLEEVFGPLDPAPAKELAEAYTTAQKERDRKPGDSTVRRRQRYGYVVVKLEEYKREKDELSASASGYEKTRDLAQKKDPYFDAAELLLQIAIVLASVAMLSKARWAFVASIVLAAGGLLLTLNGYYPVADLPFIGGGEAGGH